MHKREAGSFLSGKGFLLLSKLLYFPQFLPSAVYCFLLGLRSSSL